MGFSTTEFMNRYGYYPRSGSSDRVSARRPASSQSRTRTASGQPSQSGIRIDLAGFLAALDGERAKIYAAARPAAQAAAQVIYEKARLNAPVSDHQHYFYGKSKNGTVYGMGGGSNSVGPIQKFQPGNLRRSIYQVYSDKSTIAKAIYHIGPNLKKAPYAWMVEFGTSQASAHSYIGKAVAEGATTALEAMRRTFIEEMAKT